MTVAFWCRVVALWMAAACGGCFELREGGDHPEIPRPVARAGCAGVDADAVRCRDD